MKMPFKRLNLSDIVAGFTKVQADLVALEEQNNRDVQSNADQIKSLLDRNEVLNSETEAAVKIKNNIAALLK